MVRALNVFVRTDSSVKIGSGHVMRCITLANELKKHGAAITFICRELPGNLCGFIKDKGFSVRLLPPVEWKDEEEIFTNNNWLGTIWADDAEETLHQIEGQSEIDWLIVDHYFLDRRWESLMRPRVSKILVIDDLANRPHDCDVLLDQNLYINMEQRYTGLVPHHCKKLLGPQYALLRPEFREAKEITRVRDGKVNNIMVFFGGTDPTDETSKTLEAIKLINDSNIKVNVIVGNSNCKREEIRKMCLTMENVNFHCQIDNMAEMLVQTDLVIGAGGSSTWERSFLGVPSITIIAAENQVEITEAVASAGATLSLGWFYEVTAEKLAATIQKVINNPELIKQLGANALTLMKDSTSKNIELLQLILGENHGLA